MASRYDLTRGINWTPTAGRQPVAGSVPPAGMYDPDEAATILDECFRLWGVTSNDDKSDALATLLFFFGEHGTSPDLKIQDYEPSTSNHVLTLTYLSELIGDQYRRFCRTYYNHYVRLLADNPVIKTRIGKARGYDPEYYDIACDFHDRTQLTQQQQRYVDSRRDVALDQRERVRPASAVTTNSGDGFDL